MIETLTQIADLDSDISAHIIVAPLSSQSREKVTGIQDRLAYHLGAENLWLPQGDQQHITFAHVTTPGVLYDAPEPEVFAKVESEATQALRAAVPKPLSITSSFERLKAFPAAIILTATDDGSFDELRRRYTDRFTIPEGTRQPPNIIHITIARFLAPLNMADVEAVVSELDEQLTPFTETTHHLELIHEKKIFAQEYEVVTTFPSD